MSHYTLVRTAEELRSACEALAAVEAFGFDTEMKRCSKCGVEKTISEFPLRKDSKDGRRSDCKPCRCQANRDWYECSGKSPKAYRARNYVKRRVALIREAKDKPCADCGRVFPYYVMDFDHRPGTVKEFNVSMLGRNSIGLERVLAEIEKCDVVCSNCHRIRTYERAVHSSKD